MACRMFCDTPAPLCLLQSVTSIPLRHEKFTRNKILRSSLIFICIRADIGEPFPRLEEGGASRAHPLVQKIAYHSFWLVSANPPSSSFKIYYGLSKLKTIVPFSRLRTIHIPQRAACSIFLGQTSDIIFTSRISIALDISIK